MIMYLNQNKFTAHASATIVDEATNQKVGELTIQNDLTPSHITVLASMIAQYNIHKIYTDWAPAAAALNYQLNTILQQQYDYKDIIDIEVLN